jgi:hypothetical protein
VRPLRWDAAPGKRTASTPRAEGNFALGRSRLLKFAGDALPLKHRRYEDRGDLHARENDFKAAWQGVVAQPVKPTKPGQREPRAGSLRTSTPATGSWSPSGTTPSPPSSWPTGRPGISGGRGASAAWGSTRNQAARLRAVSPQAAAGRPGRGRLPPG